METTAQKQQVCHKCSAPLPPSTPEGLCPKCLMNEGLRGDTTIRNDTASSESTRPELEQIARHLPQFEILELLGRG